MYPSALGRTFTRSGRQYHEVVASAPKPDLVGCSVEVKAKNFTIIMAQLTFFKLIYTKLLHNQYGYDKTIIEDFSTTKKDAKIGNKVAVEAHKIACQIFVIVDSINLALRRRQNNQFYL
jgi:hypothetical protein